MNDMVNKFESVSLQRLIPHPDNPNRMSKQTFRKLVRNIESTGRYEPLVVRVHPTKQDCFEIINGHHRCKALEKLGYKEADVVVWDVDDTEVDILLATLNRLCGSDELGRKLNLLKRLAREMGAKGAAELIPYTASQIEKLSDLKLPAKPSVDMRSSFAQPLVFFVEQDQQQTIEQALVLAEGSIEADTKAKRKAEALAFISHYFIEHFFDYD